VSSRFRSEYADVPAYGTRLQHLFAFIHTPFRLTELENSRWCVERLEGSIAAFKLVSWGDKIDNGASDLDMFSSSMQKSQVVRQ
jgi:hypothetical protein